MANRPTPPELKVTFAHREEFAQYLMQVWLEDLRAGRPPLSSIFPLPAATTHAAPVSIADPPAIRLSRVELRDLTGSSRKDAQFTWCRENGIPALEDVRGFPVVLRAALEARLLPKAPRAQHKRTEPDLSALQNRRQKPRRET